MKNRLTGEYLLVYVFCMAVVTGPAIAQLFNIDLTHFPDCNTYIGLAHFEFKQNPVRAYRVIIPFVAAGINYLFGGVFAKLTPVYFTGDFSLFFSFLMVNTALTSFFGLLLYRYCRAFGAGRLPSLIGIMTMLTCRYTIYMAAYPLVDSLFCVVVALTLAGLKLRNTAMLAWAIFLGPFAKESFIFIAPLIFFFSHIDKKKQVLYFLCSGLIVFASRYLLDICAIGTAGNSITADLYHIPNLVNKLPKLFSFHTVFIILMTTGLWIIAPIAVMILKKDWKAIVLKPLDTYLIFFALSVVVQILLSGSVERMFYLFMPVICVIVALSAEESRRLYSSARR